MELCALDVGRSGGGLVSAHRGVAGGRLLDTVLRRVRTIETKSSKTYVGIIQCWAVSVATLSLTRDARVLPTTEDMSTETCSIWLEHENDGRKGVGAVVAVMPATNSTVNMSRRYVLCSEIFGRGWDVSGKRRDSHCEIVIAVELLVGQGEKDGGSEREKRKAVVLCGWKQHCCGGRGGSRRSGIDQSR